MHDVPRLRRRWLTACVVGELAGFVPPALAGAAIVAAHGGDVELVLGLTAAGVAEGAVLGDLQGRALAGTGVDASRWRRATAVTAGVAWFAGMGGTAVLGRWPSPWLLAILVPAWAAGLLGMGYLQWRVLRERAPRSGSWVGVTAAAWLVGVVIPVGALSAVPNGWPLGAHAVAGVAGAVAMGAVVGSLTGRPLERLLLSGRGGR